MQWAHGQGRRIAQDADGGQDAGLAAVEARGQAGVLQAREAFGGQGEVLGLGRRAAGDGLRGVVSRHGHPHLRGLWHDGDLAGDLAQHLRWLSHRHRRRGGAEHRAAHRARMARSRCAVTAVFAGYWQKPKEATKKEFTEDGWFKTGDIGKIEDGFLSITDRKKELIKTSGGKYIAPQPIEGKLKVTRWWATRR